MIYIDRRNTGKEKCIWKKRVMAWWQKHVVVWWQKCVIAWWQKYIWWEMLIIVLILAVGLVSWYFFFPSTVYIYHGPYATYTPVDLQKKRQEEYNKKSGWWNWGINKIWLKAAVVKRKDLDYPECWKEAFWENMDDGKKVVFSVNSYTWMCLAKGKVPCDSLKVQNGCDSCTLKVIGYKKAERPYYLLRFISHKNGTFPSTPKEFAQAKYILNVKEGSGSTHITPEVYLLENCTNTLPTVLWDSKSNMINELVADKPEGQNKGRYWIGAISDSEYNELLDQEMRDSLIIQDVMINIPYDPLVIIQEVWQKDKGGIGEDAVCDDLCKNGLMEKGSKRISYLQRMYKYYIALGILRKDEEGNFYIHNPQYENRVKGNEMNVLPDGPYKDSVSVWCYFYKTVYGNLEDHYYRFERDTAIKLPVKKGKIVSGPWEKELKNKIGYRVYIGEDKKEKTPVDSLIAERDRCLYNR